MCWYKTCSIKNEKMASSQNRYIHSGTPCTCITLTRCKRIAYQVIFAGYGLPHTNIDPRRLIYATIIIWLICASFPLRFSDQNCIRRWDSNPLPCVGQICSSVESLWEPFSQGSGFEPSLCLKFWSLNRRGNEAQISQNDITLEHLV